MATNHVLTTAGVVTCGHGPPVPPPPAPPPPPSTGAVKIPPPVPARLTVNGEPVLALLPNTVATTSAVGCPLQPPATPCLIPTALTGTAQRLTVGGAPVLLAETLKPVLTGGPPPAQPTANAGQTLLRAE